MFSLAGIPPLFGFWPKLLVFQAAVDAGLVALAVAASSARWSAPTITCKIVKVMYFDDAGASRSAECSAAGPGRADLRSRRIVVSPLGYLLIGPLGALTDRAAGSLF